MLVGLRAYAELIVQATFTLGLPNRTLSYPALRSTVRPISHIVLVTLDTFYRWHRLIRQLICLD
jgi:hypothetical protein